MPNFKLVLPPCEFKDTVVREVIIRQFTDKDANGNIIPTEQAYIENLSPSVREKTGYIFNDKDKLLVEVTEGVADGGRRETKRKEITISASGSQTVGEKDFGIVPFTPPPAPPQVVVNVTPEQLKAPAATPVHGTPARP